MFVFFFVNFLFSFRIVMTGVRFRFQSVLRDEGNYKRAFARAGRKRKRTDLPSDKANFEAVVDNCTSGRMGTVFACAYLEASHAFG